MSDISIDVLPHQIAFLNDCQTPYLLLLGGLGSGKTFGFALKAIHMCILNAGYCGTIMEPTGPLLMDILVPTLDEILAIMGIKYEYKQNNNKPNYIMNIGGKRTELRLRSAENWRRQIGSNQAFVGVDEIDTMKPDDALKMIQKSKPRIRKGNKLQFFASTTPEGFGFCYRFFEKGKDAKHKTIRARTADNPFLPDSYIPDLRELYPENLINSYLEGNYTNLNSGTVYTGFNRNLNGSSITENGKEPLHIGMDFNITKMMAIVHVIRDGKPIAVDELINMYDTEAAIETIKSKYPKRSIFIYPDASGDNRKTNAKDTDIALLKAAKFRVIVGKKNPRVRDRVNCVNAMLKNGRGERRYLVNVEKCPNYAESLEQQVYDDNGEPDKTNGFDHCNDAGGYFIVNRFPIVRPKAARQSHF